MSRWRTSVVLGPSKGSVGGAKLGAHSGLGRSGKGVFAGELMSLWVRHSYVVKCQTMVHIILVRHDVQKFVSTMAWIRCFVC